MWCIVNFVSSSEVKVEFLQVKKEMHIDQMRIRRVDYFKETLTEGRSHFLQLKAMKSMVLYQVNKRFFCEK